MKFICEQCKKRPATLSSNFYHVCETCVSELPSEWWVIPLEDDRAWQTEGTPQVENLVSELVIVTLEGQGGERWTSCAYYGRSIYPSDVIEYEWTDKDGNTLDARYTVIAWRPFPEPYLGGA